MKAELVLGNLKREREALDNKLMRLAQVLSKEWKDEDQEYLCTQQYNAMQLYAHILDERIIDLEYKLEKKKTEAHNENSHESTHTDNTMFEKTVKFNCSDEKESNDGDPVDVVSSILQEIFGDDIFNKTVCTKIYVSE